MGNSQSQDSDDEHGRSPYNYHERVLRDAQQLCNTTQGGYESDDPYFSAEEGEESDRSITPLRDRPESSSGEDFSDDSVNDNDDGEEEDQRGDTIEASPASQASANETSVSFMDDSQRFLVPEYNNNNRLMTAKKSKSCGQCNVSRFQEHDSIGPELDRSRWDASSNNASIHTTRRSSQRSQEVSTYSINESSSPQSGWSNSPFMPINSPPGSQNISQRSATGNSCKRKSNQDLNVSYKGDKDFSPKRRHTLRLSPTKRRLGMLDESDSDSDDVDRKVIKKRTRQSGHSPDSSKQLGSPLLTQGVNANLKRGIIRNKNDDVMAAEELDDSPKKRIFSLRTQKLNVLAEKRKMEFNNKVQEEDESSEISNTTTKQPVILVKKLRSSAFQPLNQESNITISHQHSVIENHSPTRTQKMGNDAVRNSHGKVLPLRAVHHNQTMGSSLSSIGVADPSSNSSYPIQSSQSDSTITRHNDRSLRLRKQGDFESQTQSSPNNSISVPSELSNRRNYTMNMSNVNNNSTSAPHSTDNKDDSESNAKQSPFHNVVLTPPSSLSPSKNSTGQHLKRSSNSSDRLETSEAYCAHGDIEDAMETDESHLITDSMETQPYTPRQTTRATSGVSAAKRLKNFFTEGSISSNFKTLFLKRKIGHGDTESNLNSPADQTNWSLYSSPSPSASLFGQSPSSIQQTDAFQSTSSPIDAVHSLSDNTVSFSPILSNVTTGASPSSARSSGNQRSRQLTSVSPLAQGKRAALRKTSSAASISTRTSPRLQHSRGAHSPKTANTTHSPSQSLQGSPASQGSPGFNFSQDEVLLLPQTSQLEVLHYCLSQSLEISVTMGDIAESTSSGIVNWTDGSLTHNATDCSRRICAKAGALMRAGCNSYLENKDGILESPDVLTTPAGGRFPRSVKALLHVVSPSVTSGGGNALLATCLLEVNANCLRFASERLSLDCLSMPLIGEGEFSTQMCAEAFIDAVLIFIAEKKLSSSQETFSPSSSLSSSISLPSGIDLSSVHLVTADANVTDQTADVIQARIDSVRSTGLGHVVADIRNRYYNGNHNSSFEEGNNSNMSEETTDRARSGRPRVKRPRL